MYEEGESLTADNLSSTYLELNKKYYGSDIVSDEQIAYEWAKITSFLLTISMFISMRQAIVQHFLWRIRFWKRELRQ